MKKFILYFIVFGCFFVMAEQNSYAYSVMSQGCTVSGCHSRETVHIPTHSVYSCDSCHQTATGGGSVASSKCIACHPAGNVGTCNLTKTTTHAAAGGCTTCHTDCKSTCPAAKVLGDEDPRLIQLRIFRDTVLAKSTFGTRIINAYYNNADSINAALEKNPMLKAYSYKALQSFIPVLEIFM